MYCSLWRLKDSVGSVVWLQNALISFFGLKFSVCKR